MRPVQDGRRCAACEKDVIDLTRATEGEARARLSAAAGSSACVRMNLDRRGRPLFVVAITAAVAACGTPAAPAHTASQEAAPIAAGSIGAPSDATLPVPRSSAVAKSAGARGSATDADDDGDGVPNSEDQCPRQPGNALGDGHPKGCPYLGIVVAQTRLEVSGGVAFPRGSATLPPEAGSFVNDLVEALGAHPEITQLEIEGHASSDEPGSQKLSEARAKAMVARLVAAGVDPKRLTVRAYGATRPLEGSSPASRDRDRRVSFRVAGEEP